MDLDRLLSPRSVAVVGASERPASYGGEALLNLRRVGYRGRVHAVNPARASVHGVPCHARLADLPEAPDAVVVAIPAADAPRVVEEAGALGCGGAVVFAAGFGEARGGAALQDAARRRRAPPRAAAVRAQRQRHRLAVRSASRCGATPSSASTPAASRWSPRAATSRSTRSPRGAGCACTPSSPAATSAVLDAADFAEALAGRPGVRSLALYLEDDGDGERWCAALEACARAGVGVAVLKAGELGRGRLGRARAHRRAGRRPARRARAVRRGRRRLGADPARAARAGEGARRPGCAARRPGRGGHDLLRAATRASPPTPRPSSASRCRHRSRRRSRGCEATLPAAARAANPLDYTSLLWEDAAALRELVLALAADPAAEQVLVLYDEAAAG